jgi:hypothetical protein
LGDSFWCQVSPIWNIFWAEDRDLRPIISMNSTRSLKMLVPGREWGVYGYIF